MKRVRRQQHDPREGNLQDLLPASQSYPVPPSFLPPPGLQSAACPGIDLIFPPLCAIFCEQKGQQREQSYSNKGEVHYKEEMKCWKMT